MSTLPHDVLAVHKSFQSLERFATRGVTRLCLPPKWAVFKLGLSTMLKKHPSKSSYAAYILAPNSDVIRCLSHTNHEAELLFSVIGLLPSSVCIDNTSPNALNSSASHILIDISRA